MHECCRSFSSGHGEMNHRQLSEEEFEEIVKDVRRELTAKLAFLNDRVSKCPLFYVRLLELEFNVISPLYYRLQRHLIDWGTRSDYPHLTNLKLTQYLDEEGKRYRDKLLQYQEIRHDILHEQ